MIIISTYLGKIDGVHLLKSLTKKSVLTQQSFACEENDNIQVNTTNFIWPKMAKESGTQGRKNQVSGRHNDVTDSNEVPPLDKFASSFRGLKIANNRFITGIITLPNEQNYFAKFPVFFSH